MNTGRWTLGELFINTIQQIVDFWDTLNIQGLPGTHAVNNWGPVIWLHSQNICNNEKIPLMPRLGWPELRSSYKIILIKFSGRSYGRGMEYLFTKLLIFSIPTDSITDFINLHSYTHKRRSIKISAAKWSGQDHLYGTQRTRDTSYWFPHHIHWDSFWLVTMNCFLNISVILSKSQQFLWNVFFASESCCFGPHKS